MVWNGIRSALGSASSAPGGQDCNSSRAEGSGWTDPGFGGHILNELNLVRKGCFLVLLKKLSQQNLWVFDEWKTQGLAKHRGSAFGIELSLIECMLSPLWCVWTPRTFMNIQNTQINILWYLDKFWPYLFSVLQRSYDWASAHERGAKPCSNGWNGQVGKNPMKNIVKYSNTQITAKSLYECWED